MALKLFCTAKIIFNHQIPVVKRSILHELLNFIERHAGLCICCRGRHHILVVVIISPLIQERLHIKLLLVLCNGAF